MADLSIAESRARQKSLNGKDADLARSIDEVDQAYLMQLGQLAKNSNQAVMEQSVPVYGPMAQKMAQKYIIPENAPVLPPLTKTMTNAQLVVNEAGKAMLLTDQVMPEALRWVEYDMDLASLTFVSYSGKIWGYGQKIAPQFVKRMTHTKSLDIISFNPNTGQLLEALSVPLVARRIGL
jgi:hypothetical protein